LYHRIVLLGGEPDELGVFLYGLGAFFPAVTVADLIAETASYAKLLCHVGDLEKGTPYAAVAGMVIENGCYAVFDTFDICGIGRSPRSVQIQPAVDVPPTALQHFQKVCGRVALYGKPSGKGAVYMGMGV